MVAPDAATLDRLAADVVAGRLRVPIMRTYRLAEVPRGLPTSPATPPPRPGNAWSPA
jgi:hypothetical protein